MKRTAGARKARWGYGSSGKRGGVRIIYYWDGDEEFYMLYAFAKNEQATLTRAKESFSKPLSRRSFHERQAL
jgi:mRNA-degrading endonuclease RelE of RelBE toxin-antitoxin system